MNYEAAPEISRLDRRIMLPEKLDERSLQYARIMALIMQLLAAIVIIGGMLIVAAHSASAKEECRPFGYMTCSFTGWCLNWCNEWVEPRMEPKDDKAAVPIIKPVYRPQIDRSAPPNIP
jgi:hypothetical protein